MLVIKIFCRIRIHWIYWIDIYIYNQDFDPNTILIEVGGQYNYIAEVNNTLRVFADVLYEYFEEQKWKRKEIGSYVYCLFYL